MLTIGVGPTGLFMCIKNLICCEMMALAYSKLYNFTKLEYFLVHSERHLA